MFLGLVLQQRLYQHRRPRINRPLIGFVIYVTEVLVVIGLFAIGNMVQRAKAVHLNCTFWLIKLAIGMPSQRTGTTIDRATISLDSARRLGRNRLLQLANGTIESSTAQRSTAQRSRWIKLAA